MAGRSSQSGAGVDRARTRDRAIDQLAHVEFDGVRTPDGTVIPRSDAERHLYCDTLAAIPQWCTRELRLTH
jgi:hypothetical protein